METLDLTKHSDQGIILNTTNVEAMTDTNIEDGTKVTVNGACTVNIEGTAPTGGNDIIGFDGTDIQAGAGSDRMVALNGINMDFSKLHDIETLDLSKSGDHDLGELKLIYITGVLDGTTKELEILGDTGDSVTLKTTDWTAGTLTAGQPTVYTSVTDPTVTVKVDDDIAVTVA